MWIKETLFKEPIHGVNQFGHGELAKNRSGNRNWIKSTANWSDKLPILCPLRSVFALFSFFGAPNSSIHHLAKFSVSASVDTSRP